MKNEEWYFEKTTGLQLLLDVPFLLKHNCTRPWRLYPEEPSDRNVNMYFWEKHERARTCFMCNRKPPEKLINLYKLYSFMESI